MQLANGGPDLPADLVNDLINEQAVLFCGAGVSMNEGLPGLRSLAEDAVEQTIGSNASIEKELKNGRFEVVFQIISDRASIDRLNAVLARRLSFGPGTQFKAHSVLLELAQKRGESRVRLVTTNFDGGFTHAARLLGLVLNLDTAPKLPPVRQDWWSIVELHGSLGENGFRDLVLSSGQFGRAYMTEGWAARFVVELFRRYTVVFVGYSVDDPVIRYVVDAYRGDYLERRQMPRTYAFVGSSISKRPSTLSEWENKNVIPIWYRTTGRSHRRLYESLTRVAVLKKAGVAAPRRVLELYTRGPAHLLSAEEESQVKWALQEIRRRFEAGKSADLTPDGPAGALSRGRPQAFESWMKLLRKLEIESDCRLVSNHPRSESEISAHGEHSEHISAGQWMSKQLESEPLIRWVLDEGGFLSPICAEQIRERLRDDVRQPFGRAWSLICDLSTRFLTSDPLRVSYGIYGQATVAQRALALAEITKVGTRLRSPFRLTTTTQIAKVTDLIRPEIYLPAASHPIEEVRHLCGLNEWPEILHLAARHLLDRLDDLGHEIERIESLTGDLPVEVEYDHERDEVFPPRTRGRPWAIISALAIQALEAQWVETPLEVQERIRFWLIARHSIVHKRAVLRYLRNRLCLDPSVIATAVKNQSAALIEDFECRRMLIGLFETHRKRFTQVQRQSLSKVVVLWCQGKSVEQPERQGVWEDLAFEILLAMNGGKSPILRDFPELRSASLRWKRQREEAAESRLDHRDDSRPSADFQSSPTSKLIELLKVDYDARMRFAQWTREGGPGKALEILKVASLGSEPTIACIEALRTWIEKVAETDRTQGIDAAQAAVAAVEALTDEDVQKYALSCTAALRAVCSLRIVELKRNLLAQANRIIGLGLGDRGGLSELRDPITDSLNSAAFHLAEVACAQLPELATPEGQGLDGDVSATLLLLLSKGGLVRARGNLALAYRLLYLFTLDEKWVRTNLLPSLSERDETIARYTWAGFLWNPRFSPSLAAEVAPHFPRAVVVLQGDETTRANLGSLPVAFHYFYPEQFSTDWLRASLRLMTGKLLAEAIRGIVAFLPQQADLPFAWDVWLKPALSSALPGLRDSYNEDTTIAFVELLVALESKAEEAFALLEPHLRETAHFDHLIFLISQGEQTFLSTHPAISLRLMRATVALTSRWHPAELRQFLDAVKIIDASLSGTSDYIYLAELVERGNPG